MRHSAGFTLLEVLAALILMAFMMLGIYTGIHTVAHTVYVGQRQIEQFEEIRAAQHFLRSELVQAMMQPVAHNSGGKSLYFTGTSQKMRFVAPLPGYLGRYGPQLIQVQLVPDEDGRFSLEVSFAILPTDGGVPHKLADTQVLLKGIRHGAFRYRALAPAGQSMGGGIPSGGPSGHWRYVWQEAHHLPALVSVKLELGAGRVWPLLEVPLHTNIAGGQGSGDMSRRRLTPRGRAR